MAKCSVIKGGVCTARGFRAAGVAAEIKYKGRNDVALIVADSPCAAAAVFTTNKVAAAPVVLDREVAGWEYVGCHPCVNTATALEGVEPVLAEGKDVLENL